MSVKWVTYCCAVMDLGPIFNPLLGAGIAVEKSP
jgi:hypothetical protein